MDPIKLTMNRVDRLTAKEVAHLMRPIKDAFTRLREGVATEFQWITLASAVEIGLAVDRIGVVRGTKAHMHHAELALQAIKQRAMSKGTWCPTALYYQELDDIKAAVHIHEYQLRQLSAGEYHDAEQLAAANVQSDSGAVFKQVPAQQATQHQAQLV